jgi:hypothetical protein
MMNKKCKAIIYLSILLYIFQILFNLHFFFLNGFADKRQRKELRKGKTTTLPEHSQLEGKVSRQEDQLLPSTPMMQPIVLVKKLDLSLINSLINNWKK